MYHAFQTFDQTCPGEFIRLGKSPAASRLPAKPKKTVASVTPSQAQNDPPSVLLPVRSFDNSFLVFAAARAPVP